MKIEIGDASPVKLQASRAIFSKSPRQLILESPQIAANSGHVSAHEATVFLSDENQVERILAEGDVEVESRKSDSGNQFGKMTGDRMDLLLTAHNTLRQAILTGNVRMEVSKSGELLANTGRAVLDFSSDNTVTNVHCDRGVNLQRIAKATSSSAKAQSFELTAPAMNLVISDGRNIQQAETFGASRILLRSSNR